MHKEAFCPNKETKEPQRDSSSCPRRNTGLGIRKVVSRFRFCHLLAIGFFVKSCSFSLFKWGFNIGRNVVQSLSYVQLFATPWTVACHTSLSFTISQSLLKLMSIESVMPSNHLILCCPLLLWPSIFPGIRVFSNESVLCIRWPKYWSFYYGSNRSDTLCPLYTCCKCLLIHPSSGQN